jgi:general secretion pathway protein L
MYQKAGHGLRHWVIMMKRMLQPTTYIGNEARGTWRLDGAGIAVADADGPAMLLVPVEEVTVLAVDLPFPGRARRLAALPFAVEPSIAQPLDEVHLALGAETAPRRHLVGVVAHATMREWRALAVAAGLDGLPIVPDALAFALPERGRWAALRQIDRVLARRDDGTGFALPVALFEAAWAAAGRPPLDEAAPATDIPLDLAQGAYGWAPKDRPWRRLAIVAGAGLAAHGLIAAADTLALRGIADRWRDETSAALVAAGAQPGDDPASVAATLLPVAGGGGPPSRFLPLLDRASRALPPGIVLTRVGYGADGSLSLGVSGDPATVSAALAAAGLIVRPTPDGLIVRGGA